MSEETRLMPHDLDAEKAVLGAVLLDPGALFAASESLVPEDFYLNAHRLIYLAMLELQKRESGIDPVTLKAELDHQEKLEAAGGVVYVMRLTDGMPRGTNVRAYASLVRETSTRRQIVRLTAEASERAMTEDAAKETIETLQMDLLKLGEREKRGGWRAAAELVNQAYSEIDAIAKRKTDITGLDTGYSELNRITQGFHRGEMAVIAGRPGHGKAQPLDSPVLTEKGFVAMGDLQLGDLVIGSDGKPTEVLGVYPQGNMDVYRISLTDGTSCECTGCHLWFTRSRNEQKRNVPGSVKTTNEIVSTLHRADGPVNHYLPVVAPVTFPPGTDLLLPPYLMGLFLGDGSLTGTCMYFHKPERDLQEYVLSHLPGGDRGVPIPDGVRIRKASNGMERSQTAQILEHYGIAGCDSPSKFIPEDYLFATVAERIDLLCGLCDTDGHVTKEGTSVEYSTSSEAMADGVAFLARSLGALVRRTDRIPGYRYNGKSLKGKTSHRIFIHPPDGIVPVRSQKNLQRWKGESSRFRRAISSIDPVGAKPCQCIKVAAENGLYVTDNFIVTHNTSFVMNVVANAILRHGTRAAVFSLEMTAIEIMKRLLYSEAEIDSYRASSGFLKKEDWTRLSTSAGQIAETHLWVDESGSLTIMELRSRVQRLAIEHGVDLVVVDYLQLMTGAGRRSDNREREIAEMSRGLKCLAKDLSIPVIVVSQLNRQVETHQRRPQLADLRESGAIEQDADLVMFIWRDEMRKATDDNAGIAELIIGKQRNGPTGSLKLGFLKQYVKFVELTHTQAQEPDLWYQNK